MSTTWRRPVSPPPSDRWAKPTTTPWRRLFETELIEPRRPWKVLSEGGLATDEYVDRYHHRRFRGETVHVPLVEHENNHCLATTRLRVTPDVSRSPPGPKWFSCLCSGF
ncbi:hypothetical protein [Streptomyces sp. NPDC090135]|uniref:hypothetical protein n=1 Tax=Streptomyces sp. NPDC090135 TaxID=3365957 RepID=UPI0037FC9177